MLQAAQMALQAAPTIASLFGGKKKSTGTPPQNISGYGALPDYIKRGIGERFQAVNSTTRPLQREYFEKVGLDPNNPLYNPELAKLQRMNPEEPLHQAGILAQLHPAQIAALQAQANPDISDEGLAQYMRPFNDIQAERERGFNEGIDKYKTQIQSQNDLMNSRVNPATNLPLQLQLNDIERNRQTGLSGIRADLQERGFDKAMGLRNQLLGQQYAAGDVYNQYHQQQLNNAGGYNRFINNPNVGQAIGYNQLVQPYLGGQQQMGGIPERPNMMSRIAGAGQSLLNMNYGFGQQQQQQGGYNPYNGQQYNSTNNIQGTPWNTANPYGR